MTGANACTPAADFNVLPCYRSTIAISVDASAIQYVLRVAPGIIDSAASPVFIAPIGATVVTVVRNSGDVVSEFTVGMACGPGIGSIDSQIATLIPGTISPPVPQTITFKVRQNLLTLNESCLTYANSSGLPGRDGRCPVRLRRVPS